MINIAILDTGCNPHDFFNDKNIEFIEDDNGHGTQINGIVSSIAPFSHIINFKIADEKGQSKAKYVNNALIKAIELNVDIILLAIGSPTDYKEMHKLIKEAHKQGIIIISASGNSRQHIYYPASYKEVISVGALLSDNKTKAPWSQSADIYTIGYNIATTTNDNDWFKATGTSFASAIITGYVAQLINDKGKMMHTKVRKELLKIGGVLDGYK